LGSSDEINHTTRRWLGQHADDRIDIQGVRRFLELIAPLEIDVLPGDEGDLFGCLRTLRIPRSFLTPIIRRAGEKG